VTGNVEKTTTAWLSRRMLQSHSSFFRSFASLTTIAGYAGTDYIFPGVLTPPVPGDNVVQGKILGFLPAILTGVVVTIENL